MSTPYEPHAIAQMTSRRWRRVDGVVLLNIATTARRYNSYSGAAIGGTLLMLIPVAYYDGLLFEFAKSFAISALLGGGLGAYLSLRKDGVGEKAGEFGSAVVNKVKEI